MNMKKTIAAVAACAMAVSAMATTVSAVDENATAAKSVHYDLTLKAEKKDVSADLAFVAKNIDGQTAAPQAVVITVDKNVIPSISEELTMVVADKSTNQNYTFTFNTNTSSDKWDGVATNNQVSSDGTTINPNLTAYVIDVNTTAAGKAIANAINTANVDISISISVGCAATSQSELNDAISDGKVKAELIESLSKVTIDGNKDVYVETTSTASESQACSGVSQLNARGTYKENKYTVTKPMKSQINSNSETAEVFGILATAGSKAVGASYVNAKAVINDMIANYDDVEFKFNTATDNVFTKAALDANDGQGSWYTDSTKRQYTDYYVTGVPGAESWMGDGQYKSFAQQLYNLFGDEDSGYTYSDSYTFNNLFNVALVANNGITMNQSTVAPFEYSKTSVSFNWSDLTGGNAYITAANTLNTLQLASSSDWYWDSMDVTGYELAAEDASTEAGVEDEGEDLDDEADADDVDADDIDDVDDVDDIDDTDDADVDVDDEEVEAPVATNPSTGNAPIALAVIPVALAAAAVVAKKRG